MDNGHPGHQQPGDFHYACDAGYNAGYRAGSPPGVMTSQSTPRILNARTGQRKSGRVLQLPPPQRTTCSYNVPLPNDCDGLMFALEGKFNCGEEIINDAATRILEAVSERCESVVASVEEQAGGKLSHTQKMSRVRTLESSWVSSVFLPTTLLRIIEKTLATFTSYTGATEMSARKDAEAYLEFVGKNCMKLETITTLNEAVYKWLSIWSVAGVLERPKGAAVAPSDRQANRGKRTGGPKSSVFVENPGPPQPRGVGRPRHIPVMSMGDFVDTLDDSLDLSIMKPASRPTVYFDVIDSCCQLIEQLGAPIFFAANTMANAFHEETSAERDHRAKHPDRLTRQPANQADRLMRPTPRRPTPRRPTRVAGADRGEETSADAADRGEQTSADAADRGEETSAYAADGGEEASVDAPSVFFDAPHLWESTHLFSTEDTQNFFMETIKEAEFLVWKESRRPSTITMDTTTTTTTLPPRQHPDHVYASDFCCKYPMLSLSNQLLASSINIAAIILSLGDADANATNKLTETISKFGKRMWEESKEKRKQCGSRKREGFGVIYESVGLHLIELLLSFGREHNGKCGELMNVLCEISGWVMTTFGRYVSLCLFPSVAVETSRVLDAICPDSVKLPVDVELTKGAVVMCLVGLEEMSNTARYSEAVWQNIFFGILYCTYAASVVLARIRGWVTEASPDNKYEDVGVMKALLQLLPDALQEKTLYLLAQRKAATNLDHLGPLHSANDIEAVLGHQPTLNEPIDTHSHRCVEEVTKYTEDYHDILYACTTIMYTLINEYSNFRRFLRAHIVILHKIAVLSKSSAICRLVLSLKSDRAHCCSELTDEDLCLAPGYEVNDYAR